MNRWTADRLAALNALRRQGLSMAECATELGVSKNAVTGAMHRQSTDRQPAQRRRPPTPRTEPTWWAEARSLRAEGLTYEAIAERLGREPKSVLRVCKTASRAPERPRQSTPDTRGERA